VSSGAALTAASKTLSCSASSGTYTCLAWGLNAGVISNGAVAVVNLTMAVGLTATPIVIGNNVASSPAGTAVPLSATGGTVTGGAWPTVTSLSCLPTTLNSSGNSTCTVTLNGAAPTGGASVTLTNTNSTLTVPASVMVAAAATSATFTATAGTIINDQSATITASYNNSSANTSISLGATQYQLTTSASPAEGGTVTPAKSGFYAAGTVVSLVATANSGYQFSNWSGSVAAANSAATTVTMTAAEAVTANFVSLTGITIQTNPTGLQFSVDGGVAQTAPQTLNLAPGTHTIAVVTTQAGGAPSGPGTQYVFTQWSDGLGASHNITVGTSAATYTATFAVQYLLTTTVSPAGAGSLTASPSSGGYYNAGTSVQLTASANAGFQFGIWAGDLSGSTNPLSITMNAAHSVTANFSTPSCSIGLTPAAVSLPATGTSTVEACPNNSGQPNCGVTPEFPLSFTVTPSAACGAWTATSSNPGVLQIASGGVPSGPGSGAGTVAFALLNNTHTAQQSYTITVASRAGSASYSVTETGSGDSQTYREVYALYEQLLGRDPDPAGFAFWTGSGGAGLGQMADSFLTSPEAFNSAFAVMAAYQAATGGPPTYAQFTTAVTSIRAGTQTVGGLFNSLIGSSFTATNLYQNLLNRPPSASEISSANGAGLAAWFEALIGYPGTATPIGSPNNEFQSTGTYQTTLAADHTNPLYVQMIYYVTLSRDPDASGFAFWLGIANGGGPGLLFQGSAGYGTRIQILGPGTPNQGFIGSPEFQGLFAN
jgi:hypothetical protein